MFEHILAYYDQRGKAMIRKAAGAMSVEERQGFFNEADRCNSRYSQTLKDMYGVR